MVCDDPKARRRFLISTTIAKTLIYAALRIMYQLDPYLAKDWNLSRVNFGYIMGAAEFAAVPGGTLASLTADKPIRKVLFWSFLIVVITSFTIVWNDWFYLLAVNRFIFNLMAVVFGVGVQSELMELFPTDERGFVTGVSELSWSGSLLVLVPLLTLVYNLCGWRGMFLAVATSMVPLLYDIWFHFPKANSDEESTPVLQVQSEESDPGLHAKEPKKYGTIRRIMTAPEEDTVIWHYFTCLMMPSVLCFNLCAMLFNFAANGIFLSFVFLAKDHFGLESHQMALCGFVVGISELLGVILSTFVADTLGLYLSMYLGFGFFLVGTVLYFAFAKLSVAAALVLLVLLSTPAEFQLVVSMAEAEAFVGPELRTTVLGINYQAHFLGRTIAAVIAQSLWDWGGFEQTILVHLCCTIVAVLLLVAAERLKN